MRIFSFNSRQESEVDFQTVCYGHRRLTLWLWPLSLVTVCNEAIHVFCFDGAAYIFFKCYIAQYFYMCGYNFGLSSVQRPQYSDEQAEGC